MANRPLNARVPTREDFLALCIDFAGHGQDIHVPRVLLVVCDHDWPAAMLLSQVMWWMPRSADIDGWVAKTHEDWFAELGLTEYQVRQATKRLAPLGLQTKLRRSPHYHFGATLHYRVDKEVFSESILKKLQYPHSEETSVTLPKETSERYTKKTTKKTTNITRKDVGVVDDPSSGEYIAVAELPQPLAEGKETEPVKANALNGSTTPPISPVPLAPLSPTSIALVNEMCRVEAKHLTRAAAEPLVATYGEGRVRAVWQYVQANRATLRTPVGFLRAELKADKLALGVVNAAWPDEEGKTEPDEPSAEEEFFIADASVNTRIDDRDTAQTKWALVASQLVLKNCPDIKEAQLSAYDAATQTYTVIVSSASAAQTLNGRLKRGILNTLQGLHAGSAVVFTTQEAPHGTS